MKEKEEEKTQGIHVTDTRARWRGSKRMGIERKGKTGKQSGESWREGVKAVQRGEKGRSCKISSFSSRSRRDSGGRARGKTNEQKREREREIEVNTTWNRGEEKDGERVEGRGVVDEARVKAEWSRTGRVGTRTR